MPQTELMNLKVLLPFRVFADRTGVSRIVAETREGSFGLLPHRRDCVAALARPVAMGAGDPARTPRDLSVSAGAAAAAV